MSFEFEEEKLNNPPTKNTQEAITTFWGIYAWPYQRYNRYAQLEGLEQTADETKTMAEALRYITGASELGLSIDGGLGWLSGPDVNVRILERDVKPIVFGRSKHVPEPKSAPKSLLRYTEYSPVSLQQNQRYQELERMCKAAGYQGKYLDAAVFMMLENEPAPPPLDEASEAKLAVQDRQSSRGGIRVRIAEDDAGTVTDSLMNANVAQTGFGQPAAYATQPPVYSQPAVFGQPQVNANEMMVPTYGNPPVFNTNGNANSYGPYPTPYSPTAQLNTGYVGGGTGIPSTDHANSYVPDPSDFIDQYDADDDEGDAADAAEPPVSRRVTEVTQNRQRQRYSRVEANPLKPADLTIAQKEMLLEIEWAQRAFMQSYTIAVIDNADAFKGVNTLTIARLPCRHLPMLLREDFWDSLPNLQKLSLAIIPDWRDVAKHPAGWVHEVPLSPSASVACVYQLLQEHIADRENIKSLHLEWIGGGEYAAGLFSRNQHVIPAPIISKAIDMVDRKQLQPILRLPHLKHFSMKNCYVTPHILGRFVLGLKRDGIESITFDSVSLTANVPQGTHPAPLQTLHVVAQAPAPLHPPAQPAQPAQNQAVQANQWGNQWGAAQVNAGIPAALPIALQAVTLVPAVVAHTPYAQPDWLDPPRTGSWASIIDALTPHQTIAQCRYARGFGYEPESSSSTTIKKLDFTSCGYVRLPLDFNQMLLNSPNLTFASPAITKRMNDIEAYMVKPSDSLLGIIVNYMRPREVDALQNVFAFTVGWSTRGTDRDELIADCEADGFTDAGRGRFDGIITANLAH